MTRTGFVVACLMLTQACASLSPKSQNILQGEAASNGSFDGDWSAVMVQTVPKQKISSYIVSCAHFSESFFIRVKNGVATGFLEADENYSFRTYVDKSGVFAARIPTELQYRNLENRSGNESGIVLILHGTLGDTKPSGSFVIADPALRYQGCVTSVQYLSL